MGTPISSGNRGVLALGAALARLCMDSAAGTEVCLFGTHRHAGSVIMRPHGKSVNIPMIHCRITPRTHPRHQILVITFFSFIYRFLPIPPLRRWISKTIPWIKALESAEQVGDVRGGDSFSDIYGLQRFLLATLPVLSVIWVKGSIMLFPQTYGPYKSRISRWVARWIIRRSSVVVARDTESQRIAQELVGNDRKVILSPDVAFALHSDENQLVELDGKKPEQVPQDSIGLNVNGLMFNGGYTGKNMFGLKMNYRSFLNKLVQTLLSIHNGPLILIPHTYAPAGDRESDNEACRLLKESLPAALQARVHVVTGEYDAHQLKGIIKQCVFFIGSRMHSCIGALSQGVPCVGVAYSMKFKGVFATVGMEDWVVDGRSQDDDEAVSSITGLYRQIDVRRALLAERAKEARAELKNIFAAFLGNK